MSCGCGSPDPQSSIPPVLIRTATPDDAEAIAHLGMSFIGRLATPVQHDFDELVEVARRLTLDPKAVVFLVDDDSRAVGMIIGVETSPWFSPQTRMAVELAWWVDETHRGQGIRLVKKLEAWAKERGIDRVAMSAIETVGREATAGPIIERLGYTLAERSFFKGI